MIGPIEPREPALPEGAEAPPPGTGKMAVVRWILVGALALLAVGSVAAYFGRPAHAPGAAAGQSLYYCPMHPQIVQDHPGECPICNMSLVPRTPTAQARPDAAVAQGKYYCPMHPQIASDDPNAECKLCGGMRLLPRPVTAPVPGLVPVELPLDRVQKIGLRTAPVVRAALGSELLTVGAVEASERGLAQISPRFSGWVEELLVAETGQRVKRGQPLATIYSPDVLKAQQELITALGWSRPAGAPDPHGVHIEGMAADARARLELLGIAPAEIDLIVARRAPLRAIPLRAPSAGHVITKNAVVGMSVAAGTPLYEVADLSVVWVVAEIYEADLGRVRVGQPARLALDAYPGEHFTGKVEFVYPTIDPGARTLRLRLEFKNRPGPAGLKLLPGMYGNVTLALPPRQALLVPAEALVDSGDVQYLFVDRGQGRFEPRRVRVGQRDGSRVEVLSGVTEGEVVVTSANFLIDSESRLRAALEGRAQPAQQEP